MSKIQKTLLIIGASLLTLLVLSNSFFIYLLFTLDKNDSAAQVLYDQETRRRALIRYTPDSPIPSEHTKELVTLILKDSSSILRDEPIIFVSNPDLKPLVAEILEEEPSILEDDPLTLYKYPELMEINPNLKPILQDILEHTDDPYLSLYFTDLL